MRWEERLFEVFDDLEQQAEGLALAERDAEVAALGRAQYAEVDLAARVHASFGAVLSLTVVGVGRVDGVLAHAGADWALLRVGHGQEWLVPFAAVASWRGLSDRAVTEPARPLTARLSLRSALRSLAEARDPVLLLRRDGAQSRGSLRRVGFDFVELVTEAASAGGGASPELLALAHVAAVRRR